MRSLNQRIKEILEDKAALLGDDFVTLEQGESLQYFQNLKTDLKKAFELALTSSENFQHKLKIIFIEYDFIWGENDAERIGYLCGFGDGEAFSYPILKNASYLSYNAEAELFNGTGNIHFDIETDTLTEIIDKENDIHIKSYLKQIDIYQVYLFMHNAINELQYELFHGKENLEDEIYIYANLHDNECSNIFVVEKENYC